MPRAGSPRSQAMLDPRRDVGAKSLAGVLAQCLALAHLNLSRNVICKIFAEILAGVLAQCAALAHPDLVMDTLRPEVNVGTDLLPA